MRRSVGILVFDDVEELDFVGPLEVFGMAARLGADCATVLIAAHEGEVRGSYGLRFTPAHTIASCPPVDLLIVPGGYGARTHAREDPVIIDYLRQRKAPVASVCTGALILAAAGLLNGRTATTHHSAMELLRSYGAIDVIEGARMTVAERVSTSAGISAGIDLSLALVAHMFGDDLAEQVATRMEWDGAGDWRRVPSEEAGD
ncbi:MAG: DJ-1/PfpI family protein [Acidobacteria bacterium]|nr:DJ-1/PfpI family protein [Acidobacteriota bacterium]